MRKYYTGIGLTLLPPCLKKDIPPPPRSNSRAAPADPYMAAPAFGSRRPGALYLAGGAYLVVLSTIARTRPR